MFSTDPALLQRKLSKEQQTEVDIWVEKIRTEWEEWRACMGWIDSIRSARGSTFQREILPEKYPLLEAWKSEMGEAK